MSVGATVHYRPGQLIRCQGCVAKRQQTGKVTPVVICGVPRGSTAIARPIPSDADAVPGEGAFYCTNCKGWTAFTITRSEAA